jgi:chemotaxis protein MotB
LAGKGNRKDARLTVIIRRDEGEDPPHHGGAWKVAYADFVTAMMAFFMLMWLLNATTEVQRTGLADYFAPTNLFGRSASGSGKPFGGRTPNDSAMSVSTEGMPKVITGHVSPQPDVEEDPSETLAEPSAQAVGQPAALGIVQGSVQADAQDGAGAAAGPLDADGRNQASPDGRKAGAAVRAAQGNQTDIRGGDYAAARLTPAPADTPTTQAARRESAIENDARREQRALEQAGTQLLDAIRQDPALKDSAGQIMIDTVPEGLRIQLVDAERQPMFALGSAIPMVRVRALMQKVAPVLAALPNAISIAGHTDSLTYRGQDKGNWELSTERANASRRILMEAGLADDRIRSVTGNADHDLLMPADPQNPVNRRISIIVLRHAATKIAFASAPSDAAAVTP